MSLCAKGDEKKTKHWGVERMYEEEYQSQAGKTRKTVLQEK